MRSKHSRLANRLIRAAVNQLRRTVGGEENNFFTGQPGFNQRRIKVRHRGTGGDDNGHRLAAHFRQAQRQMTKAAFIKMGMMNKGAVFRRRKGERR